MKTRKMKAMAAGLSVAMAVSAAAPLNAEELPDELYIPAEAETFDDEAFVDPTSDDEAFDDEVFVDPTSDDEASADEVFADEIFEDEIYDDEQVEDDEGWQTVGVDYVGQMVFYNGKVGFTWRDLMAANPDMPVKIVQRSNIFSPTGYIDMMMFEGKYRLAYEVSDGIAWVYPDDVVDFGTVYMANTDQYYDELMGWS